MIRISSVTCCWSCTTCRRNTSKDCDLDVAFISVTLWWIARPKLLKSILFVTFPGTKESKCWCGIIWRHVCVLKSLLWVLSFCLTGSDLQYEPLELHSCFKCIITSCNVFRAELSLRVRRVTESVQQMTGWQSDGQKAKERPGALKWQIATSPRLCSFLNLPAEERF